MSRRTLIIGLSAILVLGAIVLYWGARSNTLVGTDAETAVIQQTTLDITVEGSGTVVPERSVHLTFGVADVVKEINVEAGDRVHVGQPLASLDTTNLALQVSLSEQALAAQQAAYDLLVAGPTEFEIAQARAAVAQAQANLASVSTGQTLSTDQVTIQCANLVTAQDTLDAALAAYDDYITGGIELDPTFMADPDSDAGRALRDAQKAYDVAAAQCDMADVQNSDISMFDAAHAALDQTQFRLDGLLAGPTQPQLDAAAAALETTRLQLQQAQNRLRDAHLVAPFDGLVTDVTITEGQRVGTSTAAITIADASQLHVDVSVDELDIPSIAIGQQVTIRLEALPDISLTGDVTAITPMSKIDQGIVTYTVRVDLTDPGTGVLLGMSGDVEILTDILTNVLVVPRAAIQRDDTIGEYVLVEQSTGDTVRVPVTTGASVNGMIVIEGNLTADQTVLLSDPTESSRRSFSPLGG